MADGQMCECAIFLSEKREGLAFDLDLPAMLREPPRFVATDMVQSA